MWRNELRTPFPATIRLSFAAFLNSPQQAQRTIEKNNTLTLNGITSNHEGVKGQVQFRAHVRVVPEGGKSSQTDTSVVVNGANAATLYVSIATNVVDYQTLTANPQALADL